MTDPVTGQPNRGSLDRLLRKICNDRGIDLDHYRHTFLERRLAARLRALGLITYRQYADVLDGDSKEYAHLLQTLTINVTEFFRDPEVWELLRAKVIPGLLAEKRERDRHHLRIWSVGCATGEEPYTLAMLFRDALGKDNDHISVSIYATDIDPDALKVAREGVYPAQKREQIPPHFRDRYTVADPSSEPAGFRIASNVAHLVHFQHYSVFDSPPMKLVDLVVCRNLFIYFDRVEQARVLDGFWNAMSPQAYLVLGRSEKLSADAYGRFQTIDSKERVYRRNVIAE